MDNFRIKYYNKLIEKYNNNQQYLDWAEVIPINDISNDTILRDMNTFEDITYEKMTELKSKVAMIKLNGGLSTSMYTHLPNKTHQKNVSKCFIKVDEDKSFLDITVEKAKKENIQLILMNSFYTN